MANKLVVATKNRHKIEEITRLIPRITLIPVDDHITMPEETGLTFEANALLKAQHLARLTNEWSLADDSGLIVDALNGAPGVYSARYAPEGTDEANRQKVLAELNGQPSKATMVSVIALVSPRGDQVTARGEVQGTIVDAAGPYGFGYDPVFYVASLGKTFGEVAPEMKLQHSHRAKALQQLQQTALWRTMINE
jgi:XTP/dITP diphosphohydrolase